MMPSIELIYDADCPNVEAARRQLRQALAETGRLPQWQEWERSDRAAPSHVKQYGSPTVLLDGKDVAGGSPSASADCCRLYPGESGGLQGVPSAGVIASALRGGASGAGRMRSGFGSWLVVLPAAGVAMLPNLACPACWPAYAGLLGSIGLGFLVETAYLLPVTVCFLVVAVGALGFRVSSRRGYGPFTVGLAAAGIVVIGKFLFDSDPAMYGGIVLLIGASIWNTWPKRAADTSCPACAESGSHFEK
jgi:hypothetical protein